MSLASAVPSRETQLWAIRVGVSTEVWFARVVQTAREPAHGGRNMTTQHAGRRTTGVLGKLIERLESIGSLCRSSNQNIRAEHRSEFQVEIAAQRRLRSEPGAQAPG